jgi:hypothetical protein
VFPELPEANLSEDEVLEKCNAAVVPPYKMVQILSGARNKDIALCRQHTISELLEFNRISLAKCSKDALSKQIAVCDDLLQDASFACANARHYCRESLKGAAELCIDYDGELIDSKQADNAFLNSLEHALDLANQQQADGKSLAHELRFEKSPLETFIVDGEIFERQA